MKIYLSLISLLLVSLLMSNQAKAQASISDEQKPDMLVVTGTYSLLLGYDFIIEHRGAKRTGRKQLYIKLEDELRRMGNPSDFMNKMHELGYDFIQAYNFKAFDETSSTNYVFVKRKR
ncbi:MAG TPA: hypothetical protein DCS93_35140 [Microscillaceae bacterium]|nr:hypothetical protein [Microscillaceae bacterium]